ncbi:hypothetical protein [Nocardia goodfellowii]|uniref:Membrane protein n=1 Tax=Nocardia goodfellowii TaxID=882446 RepID=A0ABS4QD14_9NOCA|nr:hypothetical protein [Nocardia goodfellowii]MBP2189576.1 putative membrane protein [Nocardia goodfellowii]
MVQKKTGSTADTDHSHTERAVILLSLGLATTAALIAGLIAGIVAVASDLSLAQSFLTGGGSFVSTMLIGMGIIRLILLRR